MIDMPPSQPPEGGPTRATVRLTRNLAAAKWSASLGDVTSCDLSRNGRLHPAAKSYEGEVAALVELLRAIADDAAPVALAHEAAEVKARWIDQAASGIRRDADWTAYRSGGIRAMDEVLAACEGY